MLLSVECGYLVKRSSRREGRPYRGRGAVDRAQRGRRAARRVVLLARGAGALVLAPAPLGPGRDRASRRRSAASSRSTTRPRASTLYGLLPLGSRSSPSSCGSPRRRWCSTRAGSSRPRPSASCPRTSSVAIVLSILLREMGVMTLVGARDRRPAGARGGHRRMSSGAFWAWAALGTAASVAGRVARPEARSAAASRRGGSTPTSPALRGSVLRRDRGDVRGVVRRSGGGCRASAAALGSLAPLWCLPLALGPAVFSRDAYSYLAQGEILHLGLNPYHDAPVVLARARPCAPARRRVAVLAPHDRAVRAAVPRRSSARSRARSASHLVAGVLLVRLLDLIGVALIARVRAAARGRARRRPPPRACWLAALSPLVLLQLVAAGHNDALMAGLMVAGVALAVEGRPLRGGRRVRGRGDDQAAGGGGDRVHRRGGASREDRRAVLARACGGSITVVVLGVVSARVGRRAGLGHDGRLLDAAEGPPRDHPGDRRRLHARVGAPRPRRIRERALDRVGVRRRVRRADGRARRRGCCGACVARRSSATSACSSSRPRSAARPRGRGT